MSSGERCVRYGRHPHHAHTHTKTRMFETLCQNHNITCAETQLDGRTAVPNAGPIVDAEEDHHHRNTSTHSRLFDRLGLERSGPTKTT